MADEYDEALRQEMDADRVLAETHAERVAEIRAWLDANTLVADRERVTSWAEIRKIEIARAAALARVTANASKLVDHRLRVREAELAGFLVHGEAKEVAVVPPMKKGVSAK